MNLLNDPWLPVILTDGQQTDIRMAEIARPDIQNLAFPRTDFQGAAYQLMIGVLQTVFAPEDEDEWLDRLQTPPSEYDLQQALEQITHAFNLTGDGPLFMQDFDSLESAKSSSVASLLIEAPGENGIKLNTDFFIKRQFMQQMSLPMAALALFTLQINAPSGGQGHRTGLRGGGPLSTLVLSNQTEATLWSSLWLNVMCLSGFQQAIKGEWPEPDFTDGSVFPWLAATRTSEKKGSAVLPIDVHPLQRYWAMPRRIRLDVEMREGQCDLSGRASKPLVSHYRSQNYGANYEGDWYVHPFTPYRGDPKKPEEERLSIKGQPGGISYKQWDVLRLAADSSDDGNQTPALVVEHMHEMAYRLADELQEQLRLWAFAYDMDNMKPRGFYSIEMPFVALPPTLEKAFFSEVKRLQGLATEILKQVRSQIKKAWFERSEDAKGDFSFIDLTFWQRTEAHFFAAISELGKIAKAHPDYLQLSPESARRWLKAMQRTALDIFDETVLSSEPEPRKMKDKIQARNELKVWLYYSKKPIQQFKADYQVDATKPQEVSQ